MSAAPKFAATTSAADLIAYCRNNRIGTPEGDIRDPRVLADVLRQLLEAHLEDLAERGAGGAPDATARALATLIGYVEDLTRR